MTKKNRVIDIILCAVLVLLPFLHVNVGLSVADQGYNLINFESFPDMNQTWMIATLAANLVGKMFTYLPYGHYMLGMNVYCTLLLSIVTVLMYIVLKKDYNRYGVFLGLIIAICFSWAPKVILYQYLSYYLFDCGALLLVQGLIKEKKVLMYLAGILLGINLFVRFPNILQVSLIVVVFVAAFIKKSKIKALCLNVLCCIAGWCTITVPVILAIEIVCGRGTYVGMVQSLFAMTESATSYTPLAMLRSVYAGYIENLKWFIWFVVAAGIGTLVYGFLRKKWQKVTCYVFLALGVLFILRVYWYWGIMNIQYTSYSSVMVWGTCFLILSILILFSVLCFKKYGLTKRLYAVAGLVIIFITPLGSNNALFSNYNNLYFLAPVVLGSIMDLALAYNVKEKEGRRKSWHFSALPIAFVSGLLVLVVLFQTFMFHIFFVFGDVGITGEAKAVVPGNERLAGIYTTEANAKGIGELTAFFKEFDLKDKACIVWSHSPILYYALDLECAIGHTWPMLDSYSYAEFVGDLTDNEEYPIVIYEAQYYPDLLSNAEELDDKTYWISELLDEGEYQEVFRNQYYVVCVPEN